MYMSPGWVVPVSHYPMAPSYLKNQLLGRQGHEDAITPSRASCIHVLFSLTGVLTVRVAVETQEQSVNHTLVPAVLQALKGRVYCYPGKNAYREISRI